MNRNICRPFVLCNGFIPPINDVHQDWRFLAFGYLDGIIVGNNLLENEAIDLHKIWIYYQEQGEKPDGGYQAQIVYGMRSESGAEELSDDFFWGDSETCMQFPFIFITLLQVKRENLEPQKIWEKRAAFEKSINRTQDVMAITYLTLDKSDFIFALRSKNYKAGASVIDALHRGDYTVSEKGSEWLLKYTFTVASVDKDFLMSPAISTLQDKIDTAYIYLIEKTPGSVDRIYDFLQCELQKSDVKIELKQSVLGCNDEVIVLKNVSWSTFLEFYRDKTGILNYSSPVYANHLNGVTTIIGMNQSGRTPQADTVCLEEKEESAKKILPKKSLCDVMRTKCQKIMAQPENKGMQSIKRILYQIINALKEFEGTPFTDYIFLPNVLLLNTVLDMVEELKGQVDREELWRSFYDFIKGFSLYIENIDCSNRQFVQTPLFNIKTYEIPFKLNVFYNAYIYNLKKYLNGMVERQEDQLEHEYEFLICPGAASDLRVRELFKKISDTKRLFLVESPEKDMFEPKMTLIILTHELGHVVGTGIRNREERFEIAKSVVSKIVSCYIRNGLKEYLQKDAEEWNYINGNGDFWKVLEGKIAGIFRGYPNKNHIMRDEIGTGSDTEKEYIRNLIDSRTFHSDVVQQELIGGITEYLEKNKDVVWNYLLEKKYLYWLEHDPNQAKDKKAQMKLRLKELTDRMEVHRGRNTHVLNFQNAISLTFNLFSECLADLVCILTLHLSIKDYLGTVVCKSEQLGYTELDGTEMVLRSVLVVYCMHNSEEGKNLGYRWHDEDLEEITPEAAEFDIMNIVMERLQVSLKESEKPEELRDIESSLGMLYDPLLMAEMTKYLSTCVEKFAYYNSSETRGLEEQRKKLEEVYRQFEEKDIEKLVNSMQIYIDKYFSELRSDYAKILLGGMCKNEDSISSKIS